MRALRTRVLAAVIFAVFALTTTGCQQSAPLYEGPRFSVMTYNVDRDKPGSERTLDTIAEADADVVALEETNAEWESAVRARLGGQYPHMEFRHFEKGGGLALLSKFPVAERQYIQSPAGKYPGWIVWIETPVGAVEFLVVHLHAQVDGEGHFTLRSRAADRLAEITAYTSGMRPEVPRIVLGDFNEGETGPAVRYVKSLGFTNALPEFDHLSKTWSPTRIVKLPTRRIDHMLYSPPLKCLKSAVKGFGGSDHRAVWAQFGAASQ